MGQVCSKKQKNLKNAESDDMFEMYGNFVPKEKSAGPVSNGFNPPLSDKSLDQISESRQERYTLIINIYKISDICVVFIYDY